MHRVERVQQIGRHWNGADHATLSLPQALEHDHAAGQVDLLRRQGTGKRGGVRVV
jgi:hypothetical protein